MAVPWDQIDYNNVQPNASQGSYGPMGVGRAPIPQPPAAPSPNPLAGIGGAITQMQQNPLAGIGDTINRMQQGPNGPLMTQGYTQMTNGRQNVTSNRPQQSVNILETGNPFAPQNPMQAPGNNLTNPGYGEQAFEYTQNRLLEDPYQDQLQHQYQQTQGQQQGEQYLNQNLGTLSGPGEGQQYWNQVGGQFNDPFAGEQFTREATQNMSAQGPASAFHTTAMGQYDDFTGFTGPGNTQSQYGSSSASLAGGTAGERGLSQVASQATGGSQYTGPNRAGSQYEQTQGAFGAMPVANFDPFYDRARQLATQDYNRQAAGRGVYGSSESLSGVGNVITDIEAQRANRSFDAEMQRAQEQRARQQLLGEQARMGDLSGLGAFAANQQGIQTAANVNNMLGNQELARNELLGTMANQADTQALGAQNARTDALSAFGNIAGQADTAETNRFTARTGAMNEADRNATDRLRTGADIANQVDTGNREDYRAQTDAASRAAELGLDRTRLGADIASQGSANDLARLQAFNNIAQGAEGQRQGRQTARLESQQRMAESLSNMLGKNFSDLFSGSQADFENRIQTEVVPFLQEAGYDEQQINQFVEVLQSAGEAYATTKTGKK